MSWPVAQAHKQMETNTHTHMYATEDTKKNVYQRTLAYKCPVKGRDCMHCIVLALLLVGSFLRVHSQSYCLLKSFLVCQLSVSFSQAWV